MTNADTGTAERRYIEPNGFTSHVFNPIVAGLTRLGHQRLGLAGARGARPDDR